MKNLISNRVNMIRTTLIYLNANPAPTSGIPAFAGVQSTAANKLTLIDQLTQIANRSVKDVTLDTNIIRIAMSNIALKIGDSVSAYAASVNNNVLRGKVTFTLPKLNKFKKDEVDDICQTIHDEANSNILVAGSFGYDATDVTDLNTAITLYRASMQNPREFTITKKQANENINTLVDETINNIFKKQMDKMVNTVKAASPEFVQGYYFAREIINIGSTTAKVRGTIRNHEGTFMVGAKFFLTKTGETTIQYQTLSIAGGKYSISHLAADDYDLYWEHTGYQQIVETNLHIPAGKEFTRNKVLQPIVTVPLTGTVNSGNTINIVGIPNPLWVPGVTIKIKNTTIGVAIGPLNFYTAANPTDGWPGNGWQLLPGQEITVTITAAMYQAFLNVYNPGPNTQTYEVTIL
jgi:hypothetical protein